MTQNGIVDGPSLTAVRAALDRARSPSGQGDVVFTRRYEAQALHAAAGSDERRRAARLRSAIDGLPISIKDLFDVAGETTMSGVPALATEPPATCDAVVVRRLKAAGAVIVGRTNMTQFALSCLGLNPALGTPLSPWRRKDRRIAGGSSSGAAASVADGMAVAAIGSDTGGSIRIPAAFCGLVGFKPTARRVDRTGVFALSRSLDSIGSIAHGVTLCTGLDAVLSGAPDVHTAAPDRVRIGIPAHGLVEGLDPEVSAAFEAACRRLAAAGAELVTADLPALAELPMIAAPGGFSLVEGWAEHARLLTRYGDRCDPRVVERFRSASNVPVSDYFEMLRLREAIGRAFWHQARDLDAIAYPTVPMIPPRLADLADAAVYHAANARAFASGGVANLLDACAISIPCMPPGGAPVGLTLMAAPAQDAALLALAARLEHAIRGAA